MIITGVGSRKVPNEVIEFIKQLPLRDHVVRSGGALGCDHAFESTTQKLEIYVPWKSFNEHITDSCNKNNRICLSDIPSSLVDIAREVASDVHPMFRTLSFGVQQLHTRNVFQVLGKNLDESEKSDMLICWTPDGANTFDKCTSKTGGTGTAIKLASLFNIPVYNICNDKDLDSICEIFNLW